MGEIRQMKQFARRSLKGQWTMMAVFTLIAVCLGVYRTGIVIQINADYETILKDPAILKDWKNLFYFDSASLRSVCFFILGAPGLLGERKAYLSLLNGKQIKLKQYFSCFPLMYKAIALRFLRWIMTLIGLVLFVVPGLIVHYLYAMAPYLMADNPNIGVIEALRESRKMMRGDIWRLFLLDLSISYWLVPCLLTLGIGLLYFLPYRHALRTVFYRSKRPLSEKALEEITRENAAAAVKQNKRKAPEEAFETDPERSLGRSSKREKDFEIKKYYD